MQKQESENVDLLLEAAAAARDAMDPVKRDEIIRAWEEQNPNCVEKGRSLFEAVRLI